MTGRVRPIRCPARRVIPDGAGLSRRVGQSGKASADSAIAETRVAGTVPGEQVVQAADFISDNPAWAGTMTVTWKLTTIAAGTRVGIVAGDGPDGISAQDHAAGLASSLTNLAAYLKQWQ